MAQQKVKVFYGSFDGALLEKMLNEFISKPEVKKVLNVEYSQVFIPGKILQMASDDEPIEFQYGLHQTAIVLYE